MILFFLFIGYLSFLTYDPEPCGRPHFLRPRRLLSSLTRQNYEIESLWKIATSLISFPSTDHTSSLFQQSLIIKIVKSHSLRIFPFRRLLMSIWTYLFQKISECCRDSSRWVPLSFCFRKGNRRDVPFSVKTPHDYSYSFQENRIFTYFILEFWIIFEGNVSFSFD